MRYEDSPQKYVARLRPDGMNGAGYAKAWDKTRAEALRDVRARVARSRYDLTVTLSTGEDILLDDVLAIIDELRS